MLCAIGAFFCSSVAGFVSEDRQGEASRPSAMAMPGRKAICAMTPAIIDHTVSCAKLFAGRGRPQDCGFALLNTEATSIKHFMPMRASPTCAKRFAKRWYLLIERHVVPCAGIKIERSFQLNFNHGCIGIDFHLRDFDPENPWKTSPRSSTQLPVLNFMTS